MSNFIHYYYLNDFHLFCCYDFRTWLLLHARSRIKTDLAIVVAILISVSSRPQTLVCTFVLMKLSDDESNLRSNKVRPRQLAKDWTLD